MKSLQKLLSISRLAPHDRVFPDYQIHGVQRHSKKVQRGDMFVAVKGMRDDGHAHIEEAIRRGAQFILGQISSKEMMIPALHVENSRYAYAILNHYFYDAPSQHLDCIAVTGTNGKTTTAYMIHALLSKRSKGGMIGTIENRMGDLAQPATYTTPDSEELQSLLCQMHERECRFVVMETSSHALDQDRCAGIEFDAAVFTNVTHEHLDYHGNLKAYIRSKLKLLELVKPQGTLCFNADDSAFKPLVDRSFNKITFGIKRGDLRAEGIQCSLAGTTFSLRYNDRHTRVRTSLIGRHNVYNLLAAFSVGLVWGFGIEEMSEVMRRFEGVPGRLQRVVDGQAFHVFVDYAHTDDGLNQTLRSLKPLTQGKLIVLFGCGGDRDKEKRPKMARVAEKFADEVILTSDNPRTENAREILKDIRRGLSKRVCMHQEPDRRKAIRYALLRAGTGDVVCIAGKGHETTQWVGRKGIAFSDVNEVRKILSGK